MNAAELPAPGAGLPPEELLEAQAATNGMMDSITIFSSFLADRVCTEHIFHERRASVEYY